jgi:purine nucleosidase
VSVRELVLFNTDIGGDIDDAVALAYLLSQPRCELLGVTTISGDPHLRASIASAVCIVSLICS